MCPTSADGKHFELSNQDPKFEFLFEPMGPYLEFFHRFVASVTGSSTCVACYLSLPSEVYHGDEVQKMMDDIFKKLVAPYAGAEALPPEDSLSLNEQWPGDVARASWDIAQGQYLNYLKRCASAMRAPDPEDIDGEIGVGVLCLLLERGDFSGEQILIGQSVGRTIIQRFRSWFDQ